MRPYFDIGYQIKLNHYNFLWSFSYAFGLAYSPLNSATLSCSSEAILLTLHKKFELDEQNLISHFSVASSVPSAQSLSPSQTKIELMHLVLSHLNWDK